MMPDEEWHPETAPKSYDKILYKNTDTGLT